MANNKNIGGMNNNKCTDNNNKKTNIVIDNYGKISKKIIK